MSAKDTKWEVFSYF